jgi:predicted KAP-like P-loop ATPase
MWSDKESEKDYLNFGEVSQLAVDILSTPQMLPISIGIFGNWGAGKSSLLKLLEKDLEAKGNEYVIINFDAWLYQGFDDARTALLEVIASELLKASKDNEGLIKKSRSLLARVNGFRVLGYMAEGAALAMGMPTGGLLSRGIGSLEGLADGIQSTDEYTSATKVASEAKEAGKELIKPIKISSPPQQIDAFRKEYGEILTALEKPLIVMIDNLDRCLPANAIHTLEAIRLFLFLPNTAFVIAADEEMVRISVAEYFKGSSDRHQIDYLDKLIQVPIRVPKAGVREIRAYIFILFAIDHGIENEQLEHLRTSLEKSLQQSWKDDPISKEDALNLTGHKDDLALARAFDVADRIAPILATSPIVSGNPRIVKRLLNVVKMRSQIAKRRDMPLDEGVITKLVIFERCAGADATADLYKMIDMEAGKPSILKELEEMDGNVLPSGVPNSWSSNATTKAFIAEWAKLEPSLKNRDLRAAIYLSRETMPIGSYVMGISAQGREALKKLVAVSKMASPEGNEVVKIISLTDQIPIMEGLVDQLRQVENWAKQPTGFAGACMLAKQSPEAAKILVRFISGIDKQPIWMTTMLKDQEFIKGK